MKSKRITSILLAGIMTGLLLTSCGEPNADNTQSEGNSREAYTVKIIANGDGSTESSQQVSEALSKITKEKFNTEIELVKGYTKEQLNLILTSGEKLDLFPVFSWEMNLGNLANNDQLVAMDELLQKYGKETLNAISDLDWESCKIGGKIYGVPANSDKATAAGVLMRKDIVDELKIDYKNIKTMEQLEEALMLVKQNKPDVYPLVSSFGATGDYTPFDGAGDQFGVLENLFEDSTTFVNYFETETYKNIINTRYEWNKKGLIMPDATSNSEDSRTIIGAGKGFCAFFRLKPGVERQESASMGTEVVAAQLFEPRSTTDMVGGKVWSIPANSEQPERAMEVLNLLYNDAQASTIFTNGIEGTHFVYTDDSKQVIDYPEGKTGTTIGYTVTSWASPNQQIEPVRLGDDLDLWKQLNTFNQSAKASPAKGFTFDNSKVLNEVTACTNVKEKYQKGLEAGSFEPEKALAEFNSDLKAAGLDAIIAEKQAQFDKWLETKK